MNNDEILNRVMKATVPNKSESEMDNVDKLIRYIVYDVLPQTFKGQAPSIIPTNLPEDYVENTKSKTSFKRK